VGLEAAGDRAVVLVLQLLFTYASPFQYLFQSASLDAAAWMRAVALSSLVFVLVELEKWWVRTRS